MTLCHRVAYNRIPKTGKSMKELYHKCLQATVAVMLGIAACGSVYANRFCCDAIAAAHSPALSRISGSHTSSSAQTARPSHSRHSPPASKFCSTRFPADSGPARRCCETDRCGRDRPATVISPSCIQDHFLPQRLASTVDAGNDAHTTGALNHFPASFKVKPIYIQTQSMIC